MSFHRQTFCASTKCPEVYPDFFLEFFDILEKKLKIFYTMGASTPMTRNAVSI